VVTIDWITSSFALRFLADDDGPIRLVDLGEDSSRFSPTYNRTHQPLVEVLSPQFGNHTSSNSGRHSGTHFGSALRYVRHEETTTDGIDRLVIEQSDPATGLSCVSTFDVLPGVPTVRTTTMVSVAPGKPAVTLWAVTSFATGACVSADINALDVWSAKSTWAAENRWGRCGRQG
jgi:alpha-galactosidase